MQALYVVSVNASIQRPIPNDEYTGYTLSPEYKLCTLSFILFVVHQYMYCTVLYTYTAYYTRAGQFVSMRKKNNGTVERHDRCCPFMYPASGTRPDITLAPLSHDTPAASSVPQSLPPHTVLPRTRAECLLARGQAHRDQFRGPRRAPLRRHRRSCQTRWRHAYLDRIRRRKCRSSLCARPRRCHRCAPLPPPSKHRALRPLTSNRYVRVQWHTRDSGRRWPRPHMATNDDTAERAHNTHTSYSGEVSEPAASSESASPHPNCRIGGRRRTFSCPWCKTTQDIAPYSTAPFLELTPPAIKRETEAALVCAQFHRGLGALTVHAVMSDTAKLRATAAPI